MTVSPVDLGSMVTFSSFGASRWRIARSSQRSQATGWRCFSPTGLGRTSPFRGCWRPDRVPVITTHSMMHRPKWVGLIARSTGSAFVLFALSNRHITPDADAILFKP
jgi:hypothetical protein